MSHNCQTILQPCLTPVAHCTLPPRNPRGEAYESIEEERCARVLQFLRDNTCISQAQIGSHLGVHDSTASKTLTRLLDLGKIELVVKNHSAFRPRRFYKIKEVLQ